MDSQTEHQSGVVVLICRNVELELFGPSRLVADWTRLD